MHVCAENMRHHLSFLGSGLRVWKVPSNCMWWRNKWTSPRKMNFELHVSAGWNFGLSPWWRAKYILCGKKETKKCLVMRRVDYSRLRKWWSKIAHLCFSGSLCRRIGHMISGHGPFSQEPFSLFSMASYLVTYFRQYYLIGFSIPVYTLLGACITPLLY